MSKSSKLIVFGTSYLRVWAKVFQANEFRLNYKAKPEGTIEAGVRPIIIFISVCV